MIDTSSAPFLPRTRTRKSNVIDCQHAVESKIVDTSEASGFVGKVHPSLTALLPIELCCCERFGHHCKGGQTG